MCVCSLFFSFYRARRYCTNVAFSDSNAKGETIPLSFFSPSLGFDKVLFFPPLSFPPKRCFEYLIKLNFFFLQHCKTRSRRTTRRVVDRQPTQTKIVMTTVFAGRLARLTKTKRIKSRVSLATYNNDNILSLLAANATDLISRSLRFRNDADKNRTEPTFSTPLKPSRFYF